MKQKRIALILAALLLAVLLCGCTINPDMTQTGDAAVAEPAPTEDTQAAETPTEEAQTGQANPEAEDENAGMEFPVELADGALTVNSLFTSNITNPDKEDEMTEDLASVQVTNTGDVYLERADITVLTAGGQQLQFVVTNLPVGETLLAFDINGTVLTDTTAEDMWADCTGNLDAGLPDGLRATVTDSTITVYNDLEVDLADVTVTYHCRMGDNYFGGISYSQTIGVLPHGSRETLTASECWLGDPVVVNVTIG